MEENTPRHPHAWLEEALHARAQAHRQRSLQTVRATADGYLEAAGRRLLDLSSNDYLGLARAPAPPTGLATGAGASRLVVGNHPGYEELEARVAALKQTEAALVIGSGYLANTGIIPALAGRGDHIFSDRLNHASIIDGCLLSGARLHRYRHNDLDHLQRLLAKAAADGRRLIVSDAIFSMDGDLADLPALVTLKERHNAMLMVDEAHSGGLFGPDGAGLVRAHSLQDRVDVQMGTFSKAYGVYGAYVAGSRLLIDYLVNFCRSLIFTTALPPMVIGSIQQALTQAAAEPWRRQRLHEHAAYLRKHLQSAGLDLAGSASQIVPVVIGGDAETLAFSETLREAGIQGVAIRPPTVPEGTARVRFSVSAAHQPAAIEAATQTIINLARQAGLTTGSHS